jgi:chromosome partitioning protein
MKTIVCAIEKGGQGKSTLASHIAWLCAALGKRVLAVDLDGQGNFSEFLLGEYDPEAAPSLGLFQGNYADTLSVPIDDSGNEAKGSINVYTGDKTLRAVDETIAIRAATLGNSLKALASRFDVCVIDSPPGSAKRMEAALIAATHVVMPFEAKTASVKGLKDLLDTLEIIKSKENRNLTIVGLLPNRINSRSKAEADILASLRKAAPGKVLPFKLHERTSIATALANQRPVWDKASGASHREAAKEMLAACTHIVKTLFGK